MLTVSGKVKNTQAAKILQGWFEEAKESENSEKKQLWDNLYRLAFGLNKSLTISLNSIFEVLAYLENDEDEIDELSPEPLKKWKAEKIVVADWLRSL